MSPSTLLRMSTEHPFFESRSLFRVVIAPTIGDDHGRESIGHYLSGRSRELALKDWEEGRTAEPPRNWGFSPDINSALQDYLQRTRSSTHLPSSEATPTANRLPPAPAARPSTPASSPSDARFALASSKTRAAEIPCVIVIAARSAAKQASVKYDADLFPGCGAPCAAAAPEPARTQGKFSIRVDLPDFLPGTRVLLVLLRSDQIARLGRVLALPSDCQFPDVRAGLEELLEATRPLRDAEEAALILHRLARDVVALEEERRRGISESGISVEADSTDEEWSLENDWGMEPERSSAVSAEFRRYFWCVSLLASAPVFEGQTKKRNERTMFDETFVVEPDVRFPASDLYCVLLVDG